MKKRIPTLAFIALIVLGTCCVAFSTAHALSPKLKNEPATDKMGMPTSQEATEQSVLPEEPLLTTPAPEASPSYGGLPVQPLPSVGISQPVGPTVDEKRRLSEAFRAAKTEAEEDFTLGDIKIRAFAAPTEREKRALLRDYYRAIEAAIIKKSAALKDKAQLWSYAQQNRIARTRTEPDYVRPAKPAAFAQAQAATAANAANATDAKPTPTPEEKSDFLPALGN